MIRALTSDDEFSFLKSSTELWTSLSNLLQAREAVDAQVFPQIVQAAERFPIYTHETSAHTPIASCLRQIYTMSMIEDNSLQEACATVLLKIMGWGRARSVDLRKEFALFAALSVMPHAIDRFTDQGLVALIQNCSDLTISSESIEFVPTTLPNWAQKAEFRARSLSELHAFVATSALAELLKHQPKLGGYGSPPGSPQSKRPKSISPIVACAEKILPRSLVSQVLAFVPDLVLSDADRQHISDQISTSQDFWSFVLLAGQIVPDLGKKMVENIWRLCVERLSDSSSSGACFCLARLVLSVVETQRVDIDITSLLQTLLWQMDSSPILSSGSIYLYCVLVELKLLDTGYQKLKSTRLQGWFDRQLQSTITSGALRMNLDLYIMLLGEYVEPVYTGPLFRVMRDDAEPLLRALCTISGNRETQSPSRTIEQVKILQTEKRGTDFSLHTGRSSIFFSKFLVAFINLDGKSMPRLIEVAEQRELFRSDFEEFLVFTQAFKHVKNLPTKNSLEDMISPILSAEVPFHEPELQFIFNRAKTAYRKADISQEMASAFDSDRDVGHADYRDLIKQVTLSVFSHYSSQRSFSALENVISLLITARAVVGDQKEWKDVYQYVRELVMSQSRFSRLRPKFAELIAVASDWPPFISTSSRSVVINAAGYITLSDDLAGTQVLKDVLDIVDDFPEPLRIAAIVILAEQKNDLVLLLLRALSLEDRASVLCITRIAAALNVGLPELLEAKCSRLVFAWDNHKECPLPIHRFGVPDMRSLAHLLPLSSLDPEWIALPTAFASFYVLGTQDPSVLDALKKAYKLVYKKKLGAFKQTILLKSILVTALDRTDSTWQHHGYPQQEDVYLPYSDLKISSDDEGAWLIEELLRPVSELSTTAEQYVGVRQACAVLRWTMDQHSNFQLSVASFLRGIVSMYTVNSPNLNAILDQAVLLALGPHVSTPLLVEITCRALSRRGLSQLKPALMENLASRPDEICRSIEMLTRPTPDPGGIPVALRYIGDSGVAGDVAPFIFDRIVTMCETGSFRDLTRDLTSTNASQIWHWSQLLNLDSREYSLWAGDLIAQATAGISHFELKGEPKTLLGMLKSVVNDHDFALRRLIAPFVRRYALHFEAEASLSGIDLGSELSPQELWVHATQVDELDMQDVCRFSASIFNDLLAVLPVPLSLTPAFELMPSLAPLCTPRLLHAVVESDQLPSKCRESLQGLVPAGMARASKLVKQQLLAMAVAAYQGGDAIWDFLEISKLAIDLEEYTNGLMFLELEWSSPQNRLCTYHKELRRLCDNIDDPDIRYGTALASDMSTIALSSGKWTHLNFAEAAYELSGEPTDGVAMTDTLQSMSLFRLSSGLGKRTMYSYSAAWRLQQWDLPSVTPPQTAEAAYFKLFQQQGPIFSEAYADVFRIDLARGNSLNLSEMYRVQNTLEFSFDKAQSDNERFARELLLNRLGLKRELALELGHNCDRLLGQRDNELAMAHSLKLQRLSDASSQDLPQIGVLAALKGAQIAWSLGNQSAGLEMLSSVLNKDSFLNEEPRGLFSAAEIFCLIGEWSADARNDTDQNIVTKYFEPSIKHALVEQDQRVREHCYHAYAEFCDSRYNDKNMAIRLEEVGKLRDARQESLKQLSGALALRNLKGSNRSKILTKIAKEQKLLESEENDYQDLAKRRSEFLTSSVRFYLKSLATGDAHSLHDSSRFIALWMGHADSDPVNAVYAKESRYLPTSQMVPWANQLTSRLSTEQTQFQQGLRTLVRRMCQDHPYHTLWQVFALRLVFDVSVDPKLERRSEAGNAMWREAKKAPSPGAAVVAAIGQLSRMIEDLSRARAPTDTKKVFKFSSLSSSQRTWWIQTLPTLGVHLPTDSITVRRDKDYSEVSRIAKVDPTMAIASGLSAPKILSFTNSDGSRSSMLVKGGDDDLRQDAIMEQVFGHVNSFLAGHSEARRRKLKLRTYNIVPIGPYAGAIEFVKHTASLMDILSPLHVESDGKAWSHARAREILRDATPKGAQIRIEAFELIEKHVHPVLRHFFFRNFRTSEDWFATRTAYSRSTAAASIVGHVLGLGDRHCSNILLDTQTGEVVHIDLGISFDNGRLLRIPETVPFRLTRDIVDGMGICGVAGIFSRCAELVYGILRDQEEAIITVLDVLRYDPLYKWTVSPLKGINVQGQDSELSIDLGARKTILRENDERIQTAEADHALMGVRRKLSRDLRPEAYVRDLVQQATSTRNLALIFEGWTPFW